MDIKHSQVTNSQSINFQVTRVESFRWKKMRTILSPWFSSSQLKSVVPIINVCVDETMDKLSKYAQNENEFNIYEILEGLTMDAIDRSAFGIHTDIQNNFNSNPLIESTRGVFSIKPNEVLATLLLCFPEFSFLINILRDFSETVSDIFGKTSHGLLLKAGQTILKTRLESINKNNKSLENDKNEENRRKDMLQLLVESRNNSNKINDINSKTLNDIEIVANIIVVHEAAYESPANILAFIIHNLINYPEIQEKCFEEINNLYNKDFRFDYNVMSGLPFTQAIICETFRLFPTDTLFTSRASDIDYRFRQFLIPKGVDIRIPTFQLHRDPEFWSEPLHFNPYRFLNNESNIDSVIYQPFGVGPRVCPGKRFGFLEIKLVLANILHKYKLVGGPQTEIGSIELDFKLITLSPKNGVYVKLEDRTQT